MMSTTLSRLGVKAATAKRPSAFKHAGIERDQRHAHEIGKRDAREHHHEGELGGIVLEARRQQKHEPGHGDLAEDGEDDEKESEAGERLAGEGACRRKPVFMHAPREEGNEGRIEGPFGEQPAEHVGHAEGDEEGVGHEGGAEHGGDQHVAHEAEHAAQDGHRADGGEAAIELHALSGRERGGHRSRACSALVRRSRIAASRLELVIFLPVRSVT